jgi:hypothetical protein
MAEKCLKCGKPLPSFIGSDEPEIREADLHYDAETGNIEGLAYVKVSFHCPHCEGLIAENMVVLEA